MISLPLSLMKLPRLLVVSLDGLRDGVSTVVVDTDGRGAWIQALFYSNMT